MAVQTHLARENPLQLKINAIIATHGALPVLHAAFAAILRKRKRNRLHIGEVSDHLRRDVGIAPKHRPRSYVEFL